MPTFIKSSNSPIFANFLSEDGAVDTGNGFFAATNISFSLDSSLEPNKTFGQSRISNDFNHSQAQLGKLALDFYPLCGGSSATNTANQMAVVTGLTGDFANGGHRILFGNLDLRQCYMSSLDIKISPQSPILFSTNFDVYDLSQISGITFMGANISNLLTTNGSGAYLESLHALALGVSGSGVSLPQSKNEIDISIQCSRTPVYGLGSVSPSTVILESVNRQTSIRGEGVGQIVGFSGGNANLALRFSPFSSFVEDNSYDKMNDYLFAVDVTGRVSSQNLSVGPDDVLQGSVVIQENVY
jgi:hypothetical protein